MRENKGQSLQVYSTYYLHSDAVALWRSPVPPREKIVAACHSEEDVVFTLRSGVRAARPNGTLCTTCVSVHICSSSHPVGCHPFAQLGEVATVVWAGKGGEAAKAIESNSLLRRRLQSPPSASCPGFQLQLLPTRERRRR